MNRRTFTFSTCAGVMVLAASAHPRDAAASETPVQLKWSDLVPPKVPAASAPARPPVAQGEVDIMEFALRDGPLADIHVDPRDPEGRWMSRPRRTPRPPAPVVPSLDGKRVTIGGYVVPLDLEERSVRELLLVPFVGACVHVPPPPSNQVVHVVARQPFQIRDLFDPVWVTGRLSVVHATTGLADAGYRLEADQVKPRGP